MELADPLRSYAVLIGSSTYADPGLDDLPAVANNLTRLGELLEDPTVWGLPRDRCLRVAEPASPTEVLDAVHEAARRAEDTLLVYYAGHGLSDANGPLLTLPSTDPQRPYTSVDFDAVRREVLTVRRNANRIVILDCCYSGGALTGGMGGSGGMNGPVEMAEQTRIAGSYLLTASAATRQALAPPGETYTAFTGELIRLLDQGLPGGDTLIEVSRIYERLHAELRAKGRPLPQQRLSNTGRTLAIARNRHGVTRAAAPSETLPGPTPAPAVPTVPDDLKAVLRGKPRTIADEYHRLRAVREGGEPRTAGDEHHRHRLRVREGGPERSVELLRLAGALRPPQEVAALIARLDGGVWGILFQEVAARGPQAIVECLEALYVVDGAEEAPHGLIEVVTTHTPEVVVGTVQAMRAAGYLAEADRLLSRAATENAYTEYVLGLLGALWSAELDADADRVLAEATTESDEDAVRFADALVTIGRPEKAFELYVRAAGVVARRPVRELISVLVALDAAGTGTGPGRSAEEAERLAAQLGQQADTLLGAALLAAVEAAGSPATVGELCEALWSAGMDGRALATLGRAAESLTTGAVVELADTLRENGHADGVRHLLRAATRASPVETTPRFVDALRDMGWPVDANRLLATALLRPSEDIVALLVWLAAHGRERDRARLVTAVNPQSVTDRLGLLKVLLAVPGDHDDFLASIALMPDEEFVEVLEALRSADDAMGLVTLFAYQIRVDPPGAVRRLGFLTDAEAAFGIEKAVLTVLLAKAHTRLRPPMVSEVVALVGPAVPLEKRVYATAALWAAGCKEQVLVALSRHGYIVPGADLVLWLVALDAHSLPECVNALIGSRSLAESSPPMLADLVSDLLAANMKAAAVFALQQYAFALGHEQVIALRRLALTPSTPAAPPFPRA